MDFFFISILVRVITTNKSLETVQPVGGEIDRARFVFICVACVHFYFYFWVLIL